MFRPEYLFVGVAFVVLAAIRVGSGPRLATRASPAPGCCSRRCCCRSSPGRSATSTSSTAWCRSRPAAARRSTSAPTCPPTANTSGSRRSWSKRYQGRDLDPHSDGAGRGRPDAAVRPRRRPLPGPAARLGPRQDRQGELLQVLRRRPARLRGDDRAQGRADVEQRRRRSDEQRRSGGRSRSCSSRSAWPGFVLLGLRRALVGAGRAGDPDRCSSPRSAPPRWRPRAATRC